MRIGAAGLGRAFTLMAPTLAGDVRVKLVAAADPRAEARAQFGKDFCAELCKTPEGRARVQDAIDRYFPMLPAFFGKSGSKNNELFRKYGIKQRPNEEMRADYLARARALVEDYLKLRLPEVAPEAA